MQQRALANLFLRQAKQLPVRGIIGAVPAPVALAPFGLYILPEMGGKGGIIRKADPNDSCAFMLTWGKRKIFLLKRSHFV